MKEKVLRNKQEQASRKSSLLESPNSKSNKIFTPNEAGKKILHHTYLCEEKENNKSFQSDNNSLKELPVLNQEHEGVSATGVSNKALAGRILPSKENTVATAKSKKDTFVLEGTDSAYEKFQNTTIDTICVPIKNGSQLMDSDSTVTTEGTSQQEIKEGNEITVPRETDLPGSMNDTCKIVLATPRFHITIPRKLKRNASKLSPPTIFQTITNGVKKNKVGKL